MQADETTTDKPTTLWQGALLLAAFAFGCTAIVAATFNATKERIAANELKLMMQRFEPVMAPVKYDTILVDAPLSLVRPGLLPGDGEALVYPVLSRQRTVAYAFIVTTIGYAGPVRLLIGISMEQIVTGVRVIEHQETPGLGDKIDAARSDWILTFLDRSIGDPPLVGWAIRADDGDFEQFTGASITPRAVVKAVRDTLLYFSEHKSELEGAIGTASVSK